MSASTRFAPRTSTHGKAYRPTKETSTMKDPPAMASTPLSSQNHAFLMLKPHANNERAREFVQNFLKKQGIEVLKDGEITAKEIEEKHLIDNHYGCVAEKAVNTDPHDLVIPDDALKSFEDCYGISWELALKQDLICNAKQAMKRLDWNTEELGAHWDELKLGVGKVKFGGGFYCGFLKGIYVINGFYMAMRNKYVIDGSSICWFQLHWQSSRLSWKKFRDEIVGDTDPATAAPHSIRGQFFKQWQTLGLKAQPHVGDNVIHGSASPLEALTEKMTWLGDEFANDAFGKLLKEQGVNEELLAKWQQNPTVEMNGRKCPLFDHIENKDASDCLRSLLSLPRVKVFGDPGFTRYLMANMHKKCRL